MTELTELTEACEALLVEMRELADRIHKQDLLDVEIADLNSPGGRIIDNGVVWVETDDHDGWIGLWGWVGNNLDPDMAHPVIVKFNETGSEA